MEKKPSWKVVIGILVGMALLSIAGLLLAKWLVSISYSSSVAVYESEIKKLNKKGNTEETPSLEFDEKYDVENMVFGIPERLYGSETSGEDSLKRYGTDFSPYVKMYPDSVVEFNTLEDGTLPEGESVKVLSLSYEDTRGIKKSDILWYDYLYISNKRTVDCEDWVCPVYFSGLYGVFRVKCSDGDLYIVNDFSDMAVGNGPCFKLGSMDFSSDFNFYVSIKDSVYDDEVSVIFSKYTNRVDYEGRQVLGKEIRVLHKGAEE